MSSGKAFERYLRDQFPDAGSRQDFDRQVEAVKRYADLVVALETARVDFGLSKLEVARRMGRKLSSISRLLNDPDPNPTVSTVADLADALGLYFRVEVKKQPAAAGGKHSPIEVVAKYSLEKNRSGARGEVPVTGFHHVKVSIGAHGRSNRLPTTPEEDEKGRRRTMFRRLAV
jgi:transcriptional regulator with XRE-family HTH domain